MVLTKYNTKQYFINDISFDITPLTHKFEWVYTDPQTLEKTRVTTDMVEYFEQKWDQLIDRRDYNQPCLVVNKGATSIILPSSLSHEAQLPTNFTKDRQKMKAL